MEDNVVSEICPHCGRGVEMEWDVSRDGFKAYCPYCGKRLMLCDACLHRGKDGAFTDDCNYSSMTDTCRFNAQKLRVVIRKGTKKVRKRT